MNRLKPRRQTANRGSARRIIVGVVLKVFGLVFDLLGGFIDSLAGALKGSGFFAGHLFNRVIHLFAGVFSVAGFLTGGERQGGSESQCCDTNHSASLLMN